MPLMMLKSFIWENYLAGFADNQRFYPATCPCLEGRLGPIPLNNSWGIAIWPIGHRHCCSGGAQTHNPSVTRWMLTTLPHVPFYISWYIQGNSRIYVKIFVFVLISALHPVIFSCLPFFGGYCLSMLCLFYLYPFTPEQYMEKSIILGGIVH